MLLEQLLCYSFGVTEENCYGDQRKKVIKIICSLIINYFNSSCSNLGHRSSVAYHTGVSTSFLFCHTQKVSNYIEIEMQDYFIH